MPKLTLTLIAALVLTACASTPQADKPALELPQAGSQASAENLAGWWKRYDDPALAALIERALERNADLAIAAARIEESAALLRVARSGYAPSVDLTAGARRARTTEKGSMRFPETITNTFNVGLDVAYEVDLWGRVRNANRAALAQLAASRDSLAAAKSGIAAQVAHSYFSLLAFDRKVELLQRTLATREEALQLAHKRVAGGTFNSLQRAQAQSERDAVAAVLPQLVAARAENERAIAVLVGESPRNIIEGRIERSAAAVLPQPPAVPEGLPSSLLMRRPDLRAAEMQLAASQARVAEARSQYFPQIILTGGLGYESAQLSDLFSPQALVWRVAAGLTQPIFGINRIDAQVDAAKARSTQAELAYVQSVQTAFKEAHDALGNLRAAGQSLDAQASRAGALQESLRIAQRRYDAGVAAWLEVLDAQRNLLSVESERIDAQAARLSASVDVFRALGGGW